MAHELDNSTGKAAFAFFGKREDIWHELGQTIEAGDSIDTIQEKAGLMWEAHTAPIQYQDQQGEMHLYGGQQVIFRSDTKAPLGTVSDRYNIVQPKAVMEFFRDFLSTNGLSISTAGAVRGGKIIWCLAELGSDYGFIMPGNDQIKSYVRLQTSFDGTRATDLVATTTRQVCANTMRMCDSDADSNGYRVTHQSEFDAKSLQRSFGLLGEQHRITSQLWNELAARRVTDDEAAQFFCELMEVNPSELGVIRDGKKLVSTRAENILKELAGAYKTGPGAELKSANRTAFGLLNAVTYYVDHESSVQDTNKEGKRTARINSAWFGSGEKLKQRASKLAASLVSVSKIAA